MDLTGKVAVVTGSGVGGDRVSVWTHPQHAVAAFADGGWSADALAEAWPTVLAPYRQSVGEAPPPSKEG